MRARLIIAYALNLLDLIATTALVQRYGIEIEANPIGRWLFKNNIAGLFKIVVVGAMFVVLGYFIKRHPKYAWIVFIPLIMYGLVVLYHIIIIVYLQ